MQGKKNPKTFNFLFLQLLQLNAGRDTNTWALQGLRSSWCRAVSHAGRVGNPHCWSWAWGRESIFSVCSSNKTGASIWQQGTIRDHAALLPQAPSTWMPRLGSSARRIAPWCNSHREEQVAEAHADGCRGRLLPRGCRWPWPRRGAGTVLAGRGQKATSLPKSRPGDEGPQTGNYF